MGRAARQGVPHTVSPGDARTASRLASQKPAEATLAGHPPRRAPYSLAGRRLAERTRTPVVDHWDHAVRRSFPFVPRSVNASLFGVCGESRRQGGEFSVSVTPHKAAVAKLLLHIVPHGAPAGREQPEPKFERSSRIRGVGRRFESEILIAGWDSRFSAADRVAGTRGNLRFCQQCAVSKLR
jgi:hypothetical protein